MNRTWNLARQLLGENETLVYLDLHELAGGDPDLLTKLELLCLYPLLCDRELETLREEYGTAFRASQQVSFDMTPHRRPVPTGGKSFFIWMLTGRVPLSLDFAGLDG